MFNPKNKYLLGKREEEGQGQDILWVCACVIYQFWHALVREYKAGSAPPKIMVNSNKKPETSQSF